MNLERLEKELNEALITFSEEIRSKHKLRKQPQGNIELL